ncbi:MAG: MBOAT family protein [Clostridiales bacterium]|nr:MBOAT family protein [Candidatus Apopatocola equi]
MVFSTLVFLFVYLPVVLGIYYLLPFRWRNVFLFLCSLFFYGWGEPVYILLMLVTITVNYIGGILVDRFRHEPKKARLILTLNTVISLSFLVFFKYADLFIGSVNSLFGTHLALLGLKLPIGISFYTFQTMSYPIDVYRGDGRVQRSFTSFGAFVTLFPQLIAGPIVRYKDIDEQLIEREHSLDKFASGAERFTLGLAKKVLLANGIGSLWDIYAANIEGLTVLGAWLGALAFAFQIYFDFSGYSDMAIGLGRMLGFDFLENFNYPYFSRSVTEFWRVWHISLGTWFRDYVYIPLGGNRRGIQRQIFNLLVVWALTGFWHGANWTFLLWGLYYAVFLIAEKLFLLKRLERAPALGHIYTLLAVLFGWMLFQLNSLAEVGGYYRAMLGFGRALFSQTDLFYLRSYLAVLLSCALASTPLLKRLYSRLDPKLRAVTTPLLMLAALFLCTAKLTNDTYNPFLYFIF